MWNARARPVVNPASICSSKTPRSWITAPIRPPRNWALSAMGAGVGLSCTRPWRCGSSPARWNNSLKAYWWDCSINNVTARGLHPQGKRARNASAARANPKLGRRDSSRPAGWPLAVNGFTWRIGNRTFTNRSSVASSTEWILWFAAISSGVWRMKRDRCLPCWKRRRCWGKALGNCAPERAKRPAPPSWSCAVCGWLWTGRGDPAAGNRRSGTLAWWKSEKCMPPEGVQEPLRWLLLTSLPCATQAQVQRVVGRYVARWWIEEYHKALKSGAGVEASQLERGDWLEPLIGVLAVVAVRLLSARMLARSRLDTQAAAASFGPQMLAILEKKFGPPKGEWTNRNVIIATVRLGGFLARKHDGMPGWQTIWRGWQRLRWMGQGVETLNQP